MSGEINRKLSVKCERIRSIIRLTSFNLMCCSDSQNDIVIFTVIYRKFRNHAICEKDYAFLRSVRLGCTVLRGKALPFHGGNWKPWRTVCTLSFLERSASVSRCVGFEWVRDHISSSLSKYVLPYLRFVGACRSTLLERQQASSYSSLYDL